MYTIYVFHWGNAVLSIPISMALESIDFSIEL